MTSQTPQARWSRKQYALDSSKERSRSCKKYHTGYKTRRRALYIIRQYGITQVQYDQMFEAQCGVCLLCSKSEAVEGRKLSIDHDHKTGKVRGLLCAFCNRHLSVVDLVGIERITQYLKGEL